MNGCMLRPAAVIAIASLVAAPAIAEPSEECAESYASRLEDAKRAISDLDAYLLEYAKARPAIEWFEAHCRFLSELEIAVRKLDDPKFALAPAGGDSQLPNACADFAIVDRLVVHRCASLRVFRIAQAGFEIVP